MASNVDDHCPYENETKNIDIFEVIEFLSPLLYIRLMLKLVIANQVLFSYTLFHTFIKIQVSYRR